MLAALVPAGVADAIHPRPRSASPILTSLVPAFEQCTAPDRTHGPPLAFPSCSSPGQSSGYVTVGTPDANGAAARFVGSVRTHSVPCSPGPPDDCEVKAIVSISDVRCTAAGSACGPANAAAGADYTGELRVDATYRMTDHFNAVAAGGGPDPATVVDITFPVSVPCAASGSTAVGGTCSINTLWNAVVPGAVKDTKRAVVEAGQTQVFDGGPDGAVATTPNTLFAVQGVFIP
jgi:hypothetical protein